MTKQEFLARLNSLIEAISDLDEAVTNTLPGAINQEKWAAEFEVPLHIFSFVASSFFADLTSLQQDFMD